MNKFNVKTDIFSGKGSLDKLKEIENKKVLIVTDEFMLKFGMVDKVSKLLKDCDISIFSDVEPDPPIEVIAKGIEKLMEIKPDLMIALGGGSPIDAGKAIKELVEKMNDYKDLKLIAIPTTSGTGSEVTMYSVITNSDTKGKYPLVSEGMMPDIAILDPELVVSAPKGITADTGMDVITHAMESYVSNAATDFTDAFAEKALGLAFEYLPLAYENGEDLAAREKMHNASCMAGLAFNASALGLNHGIAHAIGGRFKIAHGKINAILLPLIIGYNADLDNSSINNYNQSARKYYKIAKMLGLPAQNIRMGVNNLIHEINRMNSSMKIPRKLSQLGISEDMVLSAQEELINSAMSDICTQGNPKRPTEQDIKKIINKLI